MVRTNRHRKGGRVPLFLLRMTKWKKDMQGKGSRILQLVCAVIFCLSAVGAAGTGIRYLRQSMSARNTQKELKDIREEAETSAQYERDRIPMAGIAAAFIGQYEEALAGVGNTQASVGEENPPAPKMLDKYETLYALNSDMVGWLTIEGTVIDYPVMQTMEDENYYLAIDFYGQPNKNGCLIMDTDSVVGTGTDACKYADGNAPSTNLIIHGHTTKTGDMFGNLKLYADEEYGKEHRIICFDSLYEERNYELIAVFYSQVYYEDENVFKYYKFFQADTQEEFDNWYENIKELSLYDTGVTAELGDEFITLSCCAYHVEDGRFVVVGKRVD
ncbi:MAG: class B sortase [Roseburia sp.]